MKSVKYLRFGLVLAVVLSLTGYALEANAQKKTRKKTSKTKSSTTAQIIVPTTMEPEVVSRADDYQDDNQPVAVLPLSDGSVSGDNALPESTEEKLDRANARIKELRAKVKTLEGDGKKAYDDKQKRLSLNLDILTKAEQRSEGLRKQLFEMVEKEAAIKSKLDQIENDIRPEMIERQVALAGTLRPEELRDMKRKNLESERRNLQSILDQMQVTRGNLEGSVQRADQMVEKLRFKLEKDIEDALAEEEGVN